MLRRWAIWGGVALLAAPLLVRAQPGPAAGRGEAVDIGRQVYVRECASCHGEAATGFGPVAGLLIEPPPDLTKLSSRTVPFDRASIRSGITGRIRLEPSHGSSEMMFWRGTLDTAVAAAEGIVSEMDALLAYLETIQREPYGPYPGIPLEALARAGAPLFATYCAACHGRDGRGFVSQGYTLGIGAPDLTTIAARNRGEVDMRLLYEQITRGGPDGGEMPSWGHAFVKAGWSRAVTMKNIEAIAWYVESIQQR
jgi:mono/diheme cytochrome c family protein